MRSAYGALADGRDGRPPPDARTEQLVRLDASQWTNVMDLYDAILPALGAPDWQGKNLNALVDSVVWGGINALEPPFRVEIVAAENCAADIRSELAWAVEGIRQGKADHIIWRGVERAVEFEVPGLTSGFGK